MLVFAFAGCAMGYSSSASPYTASGAARSATSQWVFVATDNHYSSRRSHGAVWAFPPSLAAPVIVRRGVAYPGSIAIDGKGDLFVANADSKIAIYAPPYTGSPRYLKHRYLSAKIAIDRNDNLFVLSSTRFFSKTIQELRPPYASVSVTIPQDRRDTPQELAFDVRGNLLVSYALNVVRQYLAPTFTSVGGVAKLPTGGNIIDIGVNANNQLFVLHAFREHNNTSGVNIFIYDIEGSAISLLHAPVSVDNQAFHLAVKRTGSAFISSDNGVYELRGPAYDSITLHSVLQNYAFFGLIAVEDNGDLILTGRDAELGSIVSLSAPPYGGIAASRRIQNSAIGPTAIALGPP